MPDTQVAVTVLSMHSTTERVEFATVIEQLHHSGYTGPVTIHFRDGVAQYLEVPRPATRLQLLTK